MVRKNKADGDGPKVSVVILSYNGLDFLKACIKSIKLQSYSNIEVLVVDNDSSEKCVEYVRSLKNIRVIANKENLGYSVANNIAASLASGSFILFLNNDTELTKNFIENLVNSYEEGTLLVPRQKLMSNRRGYGFVGNGIDIFGYSYMADDPRRVKVFYTEGSALFIKKEDFVELGSFDSELFMFQDDIDLSWRAQLFGFRLKKCPSAVFYHYSGGAALGGAIKKGSYKTTYFRRFFNERNVIRNILKNYSLVVVPFVLMALVFLHMAEMISLVLLGRIRAVKCYTDAYIWNIRNIKSTLKLRSFVQRNRKVGDLTLMRRMHWSWSKLVSVRRLRSVPQIG